MNSISDWGVAEWLIIATAAFIQCIILFYVIKFAIEAGTKDLKRELEFQKRLIVKHLMNTGVSREEAINIAYRTDTDL